MAPEVAGAGRASAWSPARVFLAFSALYHVLLGGVGLALDQTFPLSAEVAARAHSEHIFGVFETNGWHSLAGLGLGLVSLYFAARPEHAREASFAVGASQVVTTVALAVWDPSTFLFASNGADQVIHSFTALAGIVAALLTQRRADGRHLARG